MITKDDYADWKRNEVTQGFMRGIQERISHGMGALAVQAGIDPLEDRMICGMIRAFREMLYVEADDVVKENDENAETSGSESYN